MHWSSEPVYYLILISQRGHDNQNFIQSNCLLQMIELLKEQMYQRTVVHDLDMSMDQILDTSSSSLPLSPWEEEVCDLKDELRREQRQQQRELEKSFEDVRIVSHLNLFEVFCGMWSLNVIQKICLDFSYLCRKVFLGKIKCYFIYESLLANVMFLQILELEIFSFTVSWTAVEEMLEACFYMFWFLLWILGSVHLLM